MEDTEGSFVVERVVEIAEAVVNHIHELAAGGTEEEQQTANNMTVESVLSRIHYYRVHDYVEQIALVNILPQLLQQHAPVILECVMESTDLPCR